MANFLDEMYGSTPRNRAGQRVTGGMLPGALAGLRDMLSGVARGSVSATLGAPADILNMTKAAQAWLSGRTNNENTDIPYGSEYFKGVLPMRPTTQTGKVAQTLGEFVPTPIPARALTEAARASAPYAARHAVNLAEKYGVSPTMNVVKPKGGNWLAGAVEDDLKPMKSYVPSEESLLRAEAVTPVGAAEARARSIPDAAINKWIDKKLNPYIKNEMGTPEDPVRALAEEGILHFQPRGMTADSKFMEIVEENRARGGFPSEDAAVTPLAKLWERYADYAVSPMQAGSRLSENKKLLRNFSNVQSVEEKNPWLLKVPPETNVYDLSAYGDFAGFPHLVDELKAAVSPTSELPANLRLTVEQLDKVTMPQAVKRVAEINAWRAKQAAEAEKQGLMTNLQATPRLKDESMQLSFVEKPGATWVDVPETVTEDGVKLCTSLGKAGGWCTQNEGSARSYGSGSNRLTTLIDAEGRPHAQAKITQNMSPYDTWYASQKPGSEELLDFERWLQDNHAQNPKARKTGGLEGMYEKWASETGRAIAQPVPKIDELKPPGNSFTSERSTEYLRRDPDYKAKVTDSVLKFLNSGTWGKVNDLQHYDIADLKDSNSITNAINNLYPGDFQKGADAFNMAADMEPNTPRFMSKSQLREFIEPSTKPEGFAKGGSVKYKRLTDTLKKMVSLDTPQDMTTGETVADIAAGFVPGVGTAQSARDFERARREGDKLGMGLAGVGMIPVVGGMVKPGKIAAKSLGELVDQYVRKVRKMDELGPATLSVHRVEAPASAEVPGWHISQDLPGILKTGAMTNKGIGNRNMQGWEPAHVGGAYFYSDPRLARAKWEDVAELLMGDHALAAEMPVIRAQLRRGNRLVPDEDVGLSVPWQQSYKEGSFATTRPVLINQIDRIYSADPDITKDIIRDTVMRQRRYAEGGLVEYDPDHIESLAQAFHEEELPGVGGDIDYKDLENLTRNVQGMRQNNIDILGAGMRFNPSEDIGVNLMGNIVQNAGPKDIRSLMLGLELADKYGVNLNKEGLQDIYANYVDDGSYYQGSYNPKYKAVNLGRMNQKDNSSLNLTISPDYKGVTYQRKFASGGAVRMGLGGFFKMVKSATGKTAKTAKAVEPEVDAGRRSFGKSLLNPTQSAENLPAATPTSIANIPMSRRTFLRAAASPVVQSTLGSLAPALASQAPSVSSIVKQATAPVAASLSTPVKAGALNLLKQANDLNVRHPLDFRDRAAVVRELAQYEGQPLVGEGGLSLKEFMRQLKADPKVYETLMKDLDYLGASVRHSYALPSKEAYLSYEPMSAATAAREARLWDKYEGRFKEPRVRGGEDSPPRMFDPNLSEFYYDYGDVDPAILPQLNKAMEGLTHDEARKIYKKAATEYQKLEKADKSKFYKEAAKENSPFGKVLSTKDLYKREDTPASTMLSAFMLNDDKWFTLPTQDEFLNILRSKGLLPEGTQMDPEQLSSIYNNALGEAKSIVQSIPYDPRHEHIDKYYKGFGIDIPEYVPLSKRNPPPAEAEFASGGAVNYNQSHIDELAAQFHKEM